MQGMLDETDPLRFEQGLPLRRFRGEGQSDIDVVDMKYDYLQTNFYQFKNVVYRNG